MENTKEIFKDIPGYEGYYQVSNMGNIRSLDRVVKFKNGRERFYEGGLIGSGVSNDGYRRVRLSISGEAKSFNVSQIVAIVYLGHEPDGHNVVVDHINGDRSDNRVENLRVVSNRENATTCFRKNKKTLSSKYVGVSWTDNSNWRVQIQYEGKHIYLGVSDSELEASKIYQKALSEINNGVFNPENYKPVYTSRYKGVTFNKASKRWRSQIWVNGIYKYLGYFNTEIEAYEALQKFKKDNTF